MATDLRKLLVLVIALGAVALAGCSSDGIPVKNAYMRGVDRFDEGLYDEAIREYLAALADSPDDRRIWYNLGLCYHEQALATDGEERAARVEKAGAAYDRAGDTKGKLARARLTWDFGDQDAAMSALDGLVGDDAVGAGAPAMTRGSMLLAAKRFAEAEAEYRRALELEPEIQEARAVLASLLIDQDRDAEAKVFLEAGIASHPYNLTLRVLDARISDRAAERSNSAEDWKDALRTWEKAEAFAAGDWEIAAGLARCSAELGETVRAVRYYWYADDSASDHALKVRGYEPSTWRADIRRRLLGLYLRLPATVKNEG